MRLDYEDQANMELHQRTVSAIEHAKALGATDEDLRLLSWHAGIDFEKEIKDAVATSAGV